MSEAGGGAADWAVCVSEAGGGAADWAVCERGWRGSG